MIHKKGHESERKKGKIQPDVKKGFWAIFVSQPPQILFISLVYFSMYGLANDNSEHENPTMDFAGCFHTFKESWSRIKDLRWS